MQRLSFFIGIAIAVALLVFVNEFTLLGNTCYFIGELDIGNPFTGEGATPCIKPGFYYLAWLSSAVAIAWGFIGFLPNARR